MTGGRGEARAKGKERHGQFGGWDWEPWRAVEPASGMAGAIDLWHPWGTYPAALLGEWHAAAAAHTQSRCRRCPHPPFRSFVLCWHLGIMASAARRLTLSAPDAAIFPAKPSPAQGPDLPCIRTTSTSTENEYYYGVRTCSALPSAANAAMWGLSSSDNCGCFSVSFVMPHCLLALLLPLRVHHTCLRLHYFHDQAAQRLRHGRMLNPSNPQASALNSDVFRWFLGSLFSQQIST